LKRSSLSEKILIFGSTKFKPLIDLWLELETYEDAGKVIDEAGKMLPTFQRHMRSGLLVFNWRKNRGATVDLTVWIGV